LKGGGSDKREGLRESKGGKKGGEKPVAQERKHGGRGGYSLNC